MTLSSGALLRILIVLLAVLIALQILIVGAGYIIRTAELGHPGRPRIIEQIAAATALIDATAPDQREDAIRAISSPFMAFSLSPAFPEDGVRAMTEPLPNFRPIISVYREALGARDFRIYARRWRRFKGPPPVMPAEVVIAIKLEDGSALIVEPSAQYRRQLAVNTAALASSVLGLMLLAGLVWASFATTRPLKEMATAAARLASDLDAPPISEKGPRPVRDLARSLNAMQADLKRLVSERAVVLAAIAHDFRTYLTRLRLRADFIESESQRQKAGKDIDEMAALIDDTLLYACSGSGEAPAAPFDFAALVIDIAERFKDAGGGVDVVAPQSLIASGHEGFIRRSVANLIDNALKYGATARVRLEESGEAAILHIEDNGTALTEADFARLSEPFFRVEASRSRATGGAGLGLAITQRLVTASGGTLKLELTPAGGLKAKVILTKRRE